MLSLVKHPERGISRADWLERECLETMGTDEMKFWGSRWRQRIEGNPDKLERVLADLRVQQKEGKAIRNAGAYAEHLWKEFV